MKPFTARKKLALAPETLRTLSNSDIDRAVGGIELPIQIAPPSVVCPTWRAQCAEGK